jgi:DNA-binding MltR family transcriptional regulator
MNMAQKPPPVNGLCEEVGEFIQELQAENDRGAAIIATAFLDDSLESILRAHFVDEPRIAEDVLGDNRPLGTFSARIDLAFLIGIIGPKMRRQLHTMRKIRNEFAHRRRGINFSASEFRPFFQSLREDQAIASVANDFCVNDRGVFLLAISQLANQLLLRGLSSTHVPPGEDFKLLEQIKAE